MPSDNAVIAAASDRTNLVMANLRFIGESLEIVRNAV
jgi:hypothetical protein